MNMECKKCDVTWELPKSICTTFKADGVQRWTLNKEKRVDLCPSCGEKGTDVDDGKPISAPGLAFTDSGTGKRVSK